MIKDPVRQWIISTIVAALIVGAVVFFGHLLRTHPAFFVVAGLSVAALAGFVFLVLLVYQVLFT